METIGDFILAFIIISILFTLIYSYFTDNVYTNKTTINFNKEHEEKNNKIFNSRDRDIKDKNCLRFIKLRNTSPPKSINPKILNFEKAQNLKIEENNFNELRFRESLYEINKNKKERNYSENKQFFNNGKIIFFIFYILYFKFKFHLN